jgi:Tfp pilus assembly protein PilO
MLLQVVIQTPTPPTPPTPPDFAHFVFQTPPPWVTMPPAAIVLITLGCFAAVAFVLFPLFRAIARRIEGKSADRELRAELDELRNRVQELESAQLHVAELEERVDFAERLLSQQQRAPERLPNG